jgi:hypothetical protein
MAQRTVFKYTKILLDKDIVALIQAQNYFVAI